MIAVAARHDSHRRLFLVGEFFSGVLVRVAADTHQQDYHCWMLEHGSGKLAPASGTIFDSLDVALERIEQLDRGRSQI